MIARDAGITPSLLQKYYPTKEAVLEAFVEEAIDEFDIFTTSVQRAIATMADTRDLMRAVAYGYIGFVDRMRGFYLTWIMCPETIEPYRKNLPAFISLNHTTLANVLARRLRIKNELAQARIRIFFAALFAWVIYYNRVGIKGIAQERQDERVTRLLEVLIGDASPSDLALIGG